PTARNTRLAATMNPVPISARMSTSPVPSGTKTAHAMPAITSSAAVPNLRMRPRVLIHNSVGRGARSSRPKTLGSAGQPPPRGQREAARGGPRPDRFDVDMRIREDRQRSEASEGHVGGDSQPAVLGEQN